MRTVVPSDLTDQKDKDLAELKKRYLGKDELMSLSWLAGAQAGLTHAKKIYVREPK